MPAIVKVGIEGFQSHANSTFSFAPGLTVITGPSDAGKTAVIRALRWLAFNEPTGEAFLHTIREDGAVVAQADEVTVTVQLDNGITISKTRRRGKTTYTHSTYPDAWEKAEIPPEISDTLGLRKQRYGDTYETCLNFAFQLDAPFLLSEAGSVGAKVLGRLAGTELVDRAIGAVNKATHKAREDRARAEKTVGQLDVELLQYLEVDDQLTALEAAERRFQTAQTRISQVTVLTDLDARFWSGIKVCQATKEQLKQLEIVDTLQRSLLTVEGTAQRIGGLKQLQDHYTAAVGAITACEQKLLPLSAVTDIGPTIEKADAAAVRLAALTQLQQTYQRSYQIVDKQTRFLATMPDADAITRRLDRATALLAEYQRLTDLQARGKQAAAQQQRTAETCQQRDADLTAAQQELTAAWDAAGGTCPLCGQVLEGGTFIE